MKVVILSCPTADLAVVNLLIESQPWRLTEIFPLLNKKPVFASAAADDSVYDIWIDAPFVVQSVGQGGTNTSNLSYRVLTDHEPVTVKNLATAVFAQFKQGQNYLLRWQEGPLTNMYVPQLSCVVMNMAGSATVIVCSTRYRYTAPTDNNPLGATTFNAITFDFDLSQSVSNQYNKSIKRGNKLKSIAAAQLGLPESAVQHSPALMAGVNQGAVPLVNPQLAISSSPAPNSSPSVPSDMSNKVAAKTSNWG